MEIKSIKNIKLIEVNSTSSFIKNTAKQLTKCVQPKQPDVNILQNIETEVKLTVLLKYKEYFFVIIPIINLKENYK